jgi:hypothetical protein
MCTFFRTITPDSLYKELSAIKSKWRVIAHSFKIPNETSRQFEGLSDPLLEVIIHWFKGAGNTMLSWDAVIQMLQDPTINEAERADKIQRLYCNYSEETIAGNERKPDSGMAQHCPQNLQE